MDNVQQFLKNAAAKRLERATPAQRALRKEVDERNARLQERGVPCPPGNTFGGKPQKAAP